MPKTEQPQFEATKDTSRLVVFTAISTIVTYILDLFFNMPVEVKAAIVVLILAGIPYLDSKIHHTKTGKFKDVNGLVPF
jgi:hypothetical protein